MAPVQLDAILSYPITRYLGEKSTLDTQTCSAAASCEVVIESDKFSPEPPDFITPVPSVVPG